ncbi:MAG TPA: metallophosphoesterase [Tepidisphaeraceae bacterium]|nr:metallophosphoesterase [Tepidisphaeraceae bacterium]
MLVSDLIWWQWAHRALGHKKISRRALDAFMLVQLGGFIWIMLGFFNRGHSDQWLPRPLAAGIFLWHFILLPIGMFILICDALSTGISRLRRKPIAFAPSRRDFLRTVALATPPIATFLATGASLAELSHFRIRRFTLTMPQLPPALDGLTIAQVSDIHVGRFSTESVLGKIVDATNSMNADLVLLSGDLIDHSLTDLPRGLEMVRQMKSRYGAFMCEGNHDLFESPFRFEQGVKSAGVPLLINETTTLDIRGQKVQLLGLEWGLLTKSYFRDSRIAASMKTLLPQRDPDAFAILLAHHPHAFDLAAEAGIPLTLSGHTHGGQLMLSKNLGVGPMIFRYWSGLYEKGDSKLIVSNGVGNWFPLRINAPAELVHITLRRA